MCVVTHLLRIGETTRIFSIQFALPAPLVNNTPPRIRMVDNIINLTIRHIAIEHT